MKSTEATSGSRDAVGVFFATEPLERAVEELQAEGIAADDIGMLAEDEEQRQQLAHLSRRFNGRSNNRLKADLDDLREDTFADTVYATFGGFSVIAFALIGAAIVAAAGIFGSAAAVTVSAVAVVAGVIGLTALIIRKSDAERLNEQVDNGHLLLFARVRDQEQERKVLEVLSRYSGMKARIVHGDEN